MLGVPQFFGARITNRCDKKKKLIKKAKNKQDGADAFTKMTEQGISDHFEKLTIQTMHMS